MSFAGLSGFCVLFVVCVVDCTCVSCCFLWRCIQLSLVFAGVVEGGNSFWKCCVGCGIQWKSNPNKGGPPRGAVHGGGGSLGSAFYHLSKGSFTSSEKGPG